jgi:hypothetical protein
MFTRQEERGKNLYSTAVWGRDEIIPRLSINIWESLKDMGITPRFRKEMGIIQNWEEE